MHVIGCAPCRVALALAAFRANAEQAVHQREQARLAVSWYADSLQARAFAALGEAVARRRQLEQQLAAVGHAVQQGQVRQAFSCWHSAAALSTSEGQLVAAAQRRFARMRLHHTFAAWRGVTEQRQVQEARLQRHLRQRAARVLSAAFGGWQQHIAELATARHTAEEMGVAQDAALAQECLLGWATHTAQQAQQRSAMVQLVQRRAAWLGLNVLHFWRAYVQHKSQQRAQLQRATRKVAAVCQRHAFAAWRQQAAWQRAEAARLAVAEQRIAARHAARSLTAAFRGWCGHTATLAAARAAVDAKVHAEGAVVRRHVMSAWLSHAEAQAARHEHILRVCVGRQCAALQSRALVAWQLFAQVRDLGWGLWQQLLLCWLSGLIKAASMLLDVPTCVHVHLCTTISTPVCAPVVFCPLLSSAAAPSTQPGGCGGDCAPHGAPPHARCAAELAPGGAGAARAAHRHRPLHPGELACRRTGMGTGIQMWGRL
jgi:hypothetical protein